MRRIVIAVVSVLAAAAVVVGYVLVRPDPVVRHDEIGPLEATADQLEAVAGAQVFFAHQSVGYNILGAVPAVFAEAGLPAPTITDPAAVDDGAALIEVAIGENGDPSGKIREFDQILRAGLAETIDVAVLKLCYIDFRTTTDVEALFDEYRTVLAALERDYPEVTFVHATAPVTLSTLEMRLKEHLGRTPDYYTVEANVVRERYSALVRAEYGESGTVFDIAAIQAAGTSDAAPVRAHDGAEYLTLDAALAADPGHLNETGSQRAATAFLATLADALS